MKTKYLIMSDLHLGSDVCQHKKINKAFDQNFTHLILNGDIIDANHAKRLSKKDWEILSKIRKFSKNK